MKTQLSEWKEVISPTAWVKPKNAVETSVFRNTAAWNKCKHSFRCQKPPLPTWANPKKPLKFACLAKLFCGLDRVWKKGLSFQELCFHLLETMLMPNAPISGLFCGLDHVGKKRLAFIPRAVLSFAKRTSSRAICGLDHVWKNRLSLQELCFPLCKTILLPLCCLDHVGKKRLAFIPRAVLSFARDHSIVQCTSFSANFHYKPSILGYLHVYGTSYFQRIPIS